MKNQLTHPDGVTERIGGFHQYCLQEKPFELTYVSHQLCSMLKTTCGEIYALQPDGYLSYIHPDDAQRYEAFLLSLAREEKTDSLTYRLCLNDGTVLHVLDTVTSYTYQGRRMADSVLANITSQEKERSYQETCRYLRTLSDIYDMIFEFDRKERTVKCLHGQNSPSFRWLVNVPIAMESGIENWIGNTVLEDDRDSVRRFFQHFIDFGTPDDRPQRTFYHARSSSGEYKPYAGVFLKLQENISLYCCRCYQSEQEAENLRQENDSLRNMQALAMQFTQGMVAFQVQDNHVKPLYTGENIWSFFGYTREKWQELTTSRPTVAEFIANSGITDRDIRKLFTTGQAQFSYYDLSRNTYRRIRAIASRKYDGVGKCHVMLYRVDTPRVEPISPVVRIRTFGYFDVFVGEKPIAFRNEKSKELLALLVDRKGGYVSSEQAIGFLWQDEPASPLTMSRYRKVALRLKNTLEEYGVADIIESVNGRRRMIPEKVSCDLYDYLSGAQAHAQDFKGSYMTNYSWSETTLAELTGSLLTNDYP